MTTPNDINNLLSKLDAINKNLTLTESVGVTSEDDGPSWEDLRARLKKSHKPFNKDGSVNTTIKKDPEFHYNGDWHVFIGNHHHVISRDPASTNWYERTPGPAKLKSHEAALSLTTKEDAVKELVRRHIQQGDLESDSPITEASTEPRLAKKGRSVLNTTYGKFRYTDQVQATEKAKNISPVLGSSKSKKEPFNGRLVGESTVDNVEKVSKISGKRAKKKVAPIKPISEAIAKKDDRTGKWNIYESQASNSIIGTGKTEALAWVNAEERQDKIIKKIAESIRKEHVLASARVVSEGFVVKDTPNGEAIGPVAKTIKEAWIGAKLESQKNKR
jgi:hypothetical protein